MTSRAAVVWGIVSLVLAGAGLVRAQAPPETAAGKAFDVASIKVNKEGGPSSVRITPGGMFTVTNNNLRNIIRNAFGITNAQIVGGPAWIDEDRFDITAKAAGPSDQPQAMAMLQALLAERFALRTHTERRELPVYVLVLARKDGALGPQMKKADVDCQALFAAVKAGGKMPAPGPNGSLPCGISVRPGQGVITVRPVLSTTIRPTPPIRFRASCSIATALPVMTPCAGRTLMPQGRLPFGPAGGILPPAFTAAKSAWQSTSAFFICGPSAPSLRASTST